METGKKIDPSLNSDQGNTLDAVAESLGISRDRWYKLRKTHERGSVLLDTLGGLLKAVATGRPFPLADYLGKLGVS